MRIWRVDELFISSFLRTRLEELLRICDLLNVEPDFNVVIVECETLKDFHSLTGRTYVIGAVYSKGIIVSQPFEVLRSKGVLEDVLLHELLHHIILLNFDLPSWMQEGLILYLTGAKPQKLSGRHKEYLLRFMREVSYEEIPLVVDRYRRRSDIESR
ncbi:hypothetical protein [Pseudothermotoga sp.]|uniref:hypothetical protein n=1 Tax=Pseudothermotoga sp. TaxID=2033661 RepID=UPI0026807AE4